jgi:flagellar protein FlaG
MEVDSVNMSIDTGYATRTAPPVQTTQETPEVRQPTQPSVQVEGTERNVNRDNELLQKAIQSANKWLADSNRQINASVHAVTKDIMIKIIDSETQEVIREIPPEKTLDAIAKMWELVGLFVDEKH